MTCCWQFTAWHLKLPLSKQIWLKMVWKTTHKKHQILSICRHDTFSISWDMGTIHLSWFVQEIYKIALDLGSWIKTSSLNIDRKYPADSEIVLFICNSLVCKVMYKFNNSILSEVKWVRWWKCESLEIHRHLTTSMCCGIMNWWECLWWCNPFLSKKN